MTDQIGESIGGSNVLKKRSSWKFIAISYQYKIEKGQYYRDVCTRRLAAVVPAKDCAVQERWHAQLPHQVRDSNILAESIQYF